MFIFPGPQLFSGGTLGRHDRIEEEVEYQELRTQGDVNILILKGGVEWVQEAETYSDGESRIGES